MSEAYGWTDEEINNLTLRRFRQVTAAIRRRRYLEDRERKSLLSWQTRTLAGFIAGGYQIEEGKENPGLELVKKIAIDHIEETQLEELAESGEGFEGRGPAIEAGSDGIAVGSFENFLGAFGDPKRWAGAN